MQICKKFNLIITFIYYTKHIQIMFPKIKKKISSFIKDEKGTISKKNLISGAIILSGIGSFAKSVKATYYPGDHRSIQLPGLVEGSNDWSCNEAIEALPGTSVGYIKRHKCHASGGSCGGGDASHTNNMNALHRNTDRSFHRNLPDLRYDKTNRKIVTQHSHHGQHANATSECSSSGTTHCSY